MKTKSASIMRAQAKVDAARHPGCDLRRPTPAHEMARLYAIENSERRLASVVALRDHLREALDHANSSETYAADHTWSEGEPNSLGVWGHIRAALELMGEHEQLERFYDTNEWTD